MVLARLNGISNPVPDGRSRANGSWGIENGLVVSVARRLGDRFPVEGGRRSLPEFQNAT